MLSWIEYTMCNWCVYISGVADNLAIGNVYATDLDDWDVSDKHYYFVGPPAMARYFR